MPVATRFNDRRRSKYRSFLPEDYQTLAQARISDMHQWPPAAYRDGQRVLTERGEQVIVESVYNGSLGEWKYTFEIYHERRIPQIERIQYRESELRLQAKRASYDPEAIWDILPLWAGALS
jgi:hypothetical protein